MKTTPITLAGREYYLRFNGAAMFIFDEEFGGVNAYLEAARGGGRGAYAVLCKAAAILAEQGELFRRAIGHDRNQIPTQDEISAFLEPMDIPGLQAAIIREITAGFKRSVEDEEDVDLTLIELERKKGNG